jgi:hypothetical protein
MQTDHVNTYNAEASSSRTFLDVEQVASKRTSSKKVERRVLPARIASSIANSASNSTSVSRELDDMVMECFVKACKCYILPIIEKKLNLCFFSSRNPSGVRLNGGDNHH